MCPSPSGHFCYLNRVFCGADSQPQPQREEIWDTHTDTQAVILVLAGLMEDETERVTWWKMESVIECESLFK